MSFKIAIGCCNRLFSEAAASLLQDEKDFHITGIFSSSPDFTVYADKMLQSNPDIFISDFATFNGNINRCLALCEKIRAETRIKVLLIGEIVPRFVTDHSLNEFIMQGVVGILPAGADSSTLKQAIRSIVSGDIWIDRTTLMKIFASVKNPEKNCYLAKREREIVLHICQGYRNKEIAQKLKISEQTVKSYCHKIYKKLGVSDRLQLVLQAHNIMPGYTKGLSNF
jgi:two-component system, NarL family, nitrate/nitrite response regulator NarL